MKAVFKLIVLSALAVSLFGGCGVDLLGYTGSGAKSDPYTWDAPNSFHFYAAGYGADYHDVWLPSSGIWDIELDPDLVDFNLWVFSDSNYSNLIAVSANASGLDGVSLSASGPVAAYPMVFTGFSTDGYWIDAY